MARAVICLGFLGHALGSSAADAVVATCAVDGLGACDEEVHEVSLLHMGQQLVRGPRSELADAPLQKPAANAEPLGPLESAETLGPSPRAMAAGTEPVTLAATFANVSDVPALQTAALPMAADLPASVTVDSSAVALAQRVERSAVLQAASPEEDDLVSAIQSSAVLLHRPPPMQGVDEEFYGKVVSPWRVVYSTSRAVHNATGSSQSVEQFFTSAGLIEWAVFAIFMPCMIMLHWYLVDWPSTRRYHGIALFIWLGVGLLYLSFIALRLGYAAATQWVTGYLLELIFSIENVFVFHVVVSAFKSPRRATQKALFVIICCQITFQGVFYCGFASTLRQMWFLPYLLGIWLLYAGYQAAISDAHADINIKETAIFKFLESLFGERLLGDYVTDENERQQVMVWKDDKWYFSMSCPLIICMVLAVFLLEIDVTLTIIDQVENEYIAFSSCAVAAWCVPELFFVARDLFQRYFLLKYGVSFVLIFFGLEMLLHDVIHIPDIVCMLMIVVVMILCVLLSHCFGATPELLSESEHEASEKPLGYSGWPAAEEMLKSPRPSDARVPAAR